jgi:hypothetical protein
MYPQRAGSESALPEEHQLLLDRYVQECEFNRHTKGVQ